MEGSTLNSTMFATLLLVLFSLGSCALGEDISLNFTWNVTWGTIAPLGVPQQVILINDMFPGPTIDCETNNNIVVNVINNLNEPFLITWNGIRQRKNSWMDGVPGTTCKIPPGQNFTYSFQVKDQVGSFFYFPSSFFHRAAGGFGSIRSYSKPGVHVPFPKPDGDFSLLIGDWYKPSHFVLKKVLDRGNLLWRPDGVLINGQTNTSSNITMEPGKTYRFRISNVGLKGTLNFRIQSHRMKLVEVEGAHTIQNYYDSLDIHVGQTYSVLVTADQTPRDYYIVASTRFSDYVLNGTSTLHYANAKGGVQDPIPAGPPEGIEWSLNQARTIRMNVTASAARPNPQGSYKYGKMNITRTFIFENSHYMIKGKNRFAVNGVSFVKTCTPLKLADYYNISGIYGLGHIPDRYSGMPVHKEAVAINATYKSFVEIVFQNNEDTLQSWHMNGYTPFVVGMDQGKWSTRHRESYNLFDAIYRSNIQVYPKSWTAVVVALDNAGMWNLRSEIWERQYLGQELYFRVNSPVRSHRDEHEIPSNAFMCGRASNLKPIPPQ